MKLSFKKLLAVFLAFAMVITAVQLEKLSIVKAEDTARTSVSASDTDCLDYILLNRYSGNGSEFGGSFSDLRWDYPSLYKLQTRTGTNGFSTFADNSTTDYRWPYMAIKVTAKETGTYTLTVKVSGNKNSTYDTFGMLVDGVVHVLKWGKSQSAHDVSTTVSLTAGTHIITFSSAMPDHPEDSPGVKDDAGAYPWFNFYGVTIDEALTLENAPTKAEVAASMATRIEAEDANYVTYDSLDASGYGYQDSDFEGNDYASGDKVVGGVSNSVITQTGESFKTYLDKKTTPYVQYTVEAPKDGIYNIRVGYLANKAAANTATDLPYCMVLVNDNAYKAQCDNEWGSLDAVNLAVELKEGRNIIRCTSFTYDQFNLYDSTTAGGWACINHDYLEVQSGLTVVENGDEIPSTTAANSMVLGNNYTPNTENGQLGTAVQGSIQADRPSIETLAQKAFLNIENWPFAAIKVTTTKAGYYDITTAASLKPVDDQVYVGVVVNGSTCGKYVAKGTTKIDTSVYLEEGENIIVYTLPMPLDDATAQKANVYNAYPWFNFLSFTLDDGMELSTTAPTLEEVLASLSNRIEAEDTTYVTYDSKSGYSVQTGDTYSNSGYAGGVSKGSIVYTYDEISEYTDVNKYAPHVQYAVNVSEAGDYAIRLGSYIGCSTKPYVAVLVNGQTYQAQFSNTWAMSTAELTVSLKEGINYIRVSTVTKEFIDKIGNVSCWVNHDYLDIQKCVSPVLKADLPGVTSVNAWDSSNVYVKNFTTITEGEVGGSDRNRMKSKRVSIETALNSLDLLTYTALKVEAESDGYYDVYVTVKSKNQTDDNAVSANMAMIVDGTVVYKIDAALGDTKHTVGATIRLTKGVHTIMVTTPMPETDAEAIAVPDGSTDGYVGENNAYPWFNFYTYSLSDGLTPAGAPTENEMLMAFTDINMDGFVNETDTVTLRKYLVGIELEINKESADVNVDTIIDIKDIVAFKKELARIAVYPTAYLSDSDENLAIQDDDYVTVYAKDALDSATGTVIEIDADMTYRTIEGFGASFTDASAYVLSAMPEAKQEEALTKLFDKQDGIGLSMLRNCIGSSDFSTEYYTYQDDETKEFALAGGQTDNILKYTQKAMELNSDMKVFLSPWTAPLWMKSDVQNAVPDGTADGIANVWQWTSASGAYLLDEYYDEYADYLVKAVKAYESNNIPVYAITAQNEPWTLNNWPGMYWDYTDLITFTNSNLKPTLEDAGLNTKILNLDYNFQNWEKGSLIMAATKDKTDGMAFHWYGGEPEEMENVMKYYPDELCYVTEASSSNPSDSASLLRYAGKIARSLRSGANGFMCWNIATEPEGGPTLNDINKHCSSLITCDNETGEIVYTRDYYALAHFSKFMKQGAVRVESTDTGADTEYALVNVVTKNTDGTMAAVLVNSYTTESKVCKLVCGEKVIEITLAPKSTVTLTWHPDFEI